LHYHPAELCANNADMKTRLTMLVIAFHYTHRSIFLIVDALAFVKSSHASIPYRIYLDRIIFGFIFESLCHILNVWLAFTNARRQVIIHQLVALEVLSVLRDSFSRQVEEVRHRQSQIDDGQQRISTTSAKRLILWSSVPILLWYVICLPGGAFCIGAPFPELMVLLANDAPPL